MAIERALARYDRTPTESIRQKDTPGRQRMARQVAAVRTVRVCSRAGRVEAFDLRRRGWVAERFKAPVLKTGRREERLVGSNLTPTATLSG